MILAARKHLLASNIFFFFVIFIIQKCIRVFCIIEEKACKNSNCPANKHCDERCIAGTVVQSTPSITSTSSKPATPPPSPTPTARGFRLISAAMRQRMQSFGFGEGHYQLFVEEKQRQQYVSQSGLNTTNTSTPSSSDLSPPSPTATVSGFRLIPAAMRQRMHSFGFGEGHYQLFVEEKQRQQCVSESRLNAAAAEVKLNPN